MEAKLFGELYQLVFSTAHPPRGKRRQYCDRWVVLMYFWSVIHDRCAGWASDARNWPATLDRPLVSQSRLSRRLRTVGVRQLVERLMLAVSERFGVPMVKLIDSKPLTVGAYSKDADAARGRSSVRRRRWSSSGLGPGTRDPSEYFRVTGCSRRRRFGRSEGEARPWV
jgi:hypothetical protein